MIEAGKQFAESVVYIGLRHFESLLRLVDPLKLGARVFLNCGQTKASPLGIH